MSRFKPVEPARMQPGVCLNGPEQCATGHCPDFFHFCALFKTCFLSFTKNTSHKFLKKSQLATVRCKAVASERLLSGQIRLHESWRMIGAMSDFFYSSSFYDKCQRTCNKSKHGGGSAVAGDATSHSRT